VFELSKKLNYCIDRVKKIHRGKNCIKCNQCFLDECVIGDEQFTQNYKYFAIYEDFRNKKIDENEYKERLARLTKRMLDKKCYFGMTRKQYKKMMLKHETNSYCGVSMVCNECSNCK